MSAPVISAVLTQNNLDISILASVITGTAPYTYTIDYDDGVTDSFTTSSTTHTFAHTYLDTTPKIIKVQASDAGAANYRSKSVVTGGSGGTDPTITLPGDIMAGDFLIATWASFYQPGGDPTGWTRALLTTATADGHQAGVACWYKIATNADAGAIVHIPLGIAADFYTAVAVAYSNCSGLHSVTSTSSTVGSTSYLTPSATANANDLDVSVWLMEAGDSGNLPAFIIDSNITTRVRADWGGVIDQFSHVGIGDEVVSAGSTTARTASWPGSNSLWAALTFLLSGSPLNSNVVLLYPVWVSGSATFGSNRIGFRSPSNRRTL